MHKEKFEYGYLQIRKPIHQSVVELCSNGWLDWLVTLAGETIQKFNGNNVMQAISNIFKDILLANNTNISVIWTWHTNEKKVHVIVKHNSIIINIIKVIIINGIIVVISIVNGIVVVVSIIIIININIKHYLHL